MAGSGWKAWNSGERVDNDQFQSYLQDQVVAVFTSTAARDAAITAPTEGMVAAVTGTDRIYLYSGSAWVIIGWYSSSGRVEARVRRTTNQSIGVSSDTTISYDTEDVDTDAIHSSGTFTVPTGMAGLWSITARHTLASVPSGRHFTGINITSAITGVTQNFRNSCYAEDIGSVMGRFPLNAADTFTVSIFQVSGGAINATAAWCDVVRIGA